MLVMRADFRDLLTFLRAYQGSPTGLTGQVHDRLPWDIKKTYRLRKFCLEEGLLELDHTGREEGWHPRPTRYYKLTTKARRLLEVMD